MIQHVYKSADQRRVGRILPDLVRARELLQDLVWKDLRARYRYATLGFLWAILEPLALMLVLTFVFTFVFAQRVELPVEERPAATGAVSYAVPYPTMLLCGLIFWQYLANALNAATQSIVGNQHLITKVHFAREVLPIAAVIFPLVNLLIGLLLLLLVHALFRGPFGPALLWFPCVFAIQFVLTTGVALLLACGQVFYRDVASLVTVGLTFGFYATPLFYRLEFVTEAETFPLWAKQIYLLNPMAELVTAYRQILFEGRFPDPSLLAWPALAAVLSLVLGAVAFRRTSPTFADHL